MYTITKSDDEWTCICQVQDGHEESSHDTREQAVQSMIRMARILNGSYITEKDIEFMTDREPEKYSIGISLRNEEIELLASIRRGAKVVLDFDDPRIKYRITQEDCELIIKIREGDLKVSV